MKKLENCIKEYYEGVEMLNKSQKENYLIPKDKMKKIINNALGNTLKNIHSVGNNGKDHYFLSQNWVKNFAKELEKYYNNIEVFYRDDNSKEFLYDITVAKCDEFSTTHSKTPIRYVSKSIWQIESEFVKNTREIAYDFSKLFSGNAPFKMMVGPIREKENDDEGSNYYMNKLKIMANNIPNDENWCFLLVTHPGNWKEGKEMIWKLYMWNGKVWGKPIATDKWKIENENLSPF